MQLVLLPGWRGGCKEISELISRAASVKAGAHFVQVTYLVAIITNCNKVLKDRADT